MYPEHCIEQSWATHYELFYTLVPLIDNWTDQISERLCKFDYSDKTTLIHGRQQITTTFHYLLCCCIYSKLNILWSTFLRIFKKLSSKFRIWQITVLHKIICLSINRILFHWNCFYFDKKKLFSIDALPGRCSKKESVHIFLLCFFGWS